MRGPLSLDGIRWVIAGGESGTDLTGMHRHTALRWVAYARRGWADYLAARAADQDQY